MLSLRASTVFVAGVLVRHAFAACSSNLQIDNFSQFSSNLNSLGSWTSDDGSMTSISPSNNALFFKPGGGYFYETFPCLQAQSNGYNGVTFDVKGPAGSSFTLEIQTQSSCSNAGYTSTYKTVSGMSGQTQTVTIPFSDFSGANSNAVSAIVWSDFSDGASDWMLKNVALKCTGGSGSTSSTATPDVSTTADSPTGTGASLVIDTFSNPDTNALGFWHGSDAGMQLNWGSNKVTIVSTDADYSFYTKVSGTCRDMGTYDNSYLHIEYSGSTKFTVALQQHNSACDERVSPFPETWDSLEAARYAKNGHIYMPISHFNINRGRVVGLAIKSFFSAESVTLSKIEIVSTVPSGTSIPSKLPSGRLVFACKRPNSFAFAIDDGAPGFAQEVMEIIKSEDIKVTFFTVGAPLEDPSTNFSNVYNEMLSRGHQVALHSYTHPKMEGLPDIASIDYEYNKNIEAVARQLNGLRSSYFRPPFGTEGARMRQRLTQAVNDDNAYIVNWSVDVEDWLWGQSSTPERQLEAFERDVNAGGNLAVLHYLYPSTVGYLRQFIQIAKATGKQLMRVDQCMEDPNAPPL